VEDARIPDILKDVSDAPQASCQNLMVYTVASRWMSAEAHVLRRHFKESIASLEINTSDVSDRIGEQVSGIAVRIFLSSTRPATW
jgi:hypothetical protein